jgi:hypothetical protein
MYLDTSSLSKKEVKVKAEKRIKVVALTDWHVPFEDKEVIRLEIEFCRQEQPEIIILHELHDFYNLSKFDQDPERVNQLQHELDLVNEYMWKLRKACPKARIILLGSNHLARLKKFLWKVAPALNCLRSLEIEKLLDLKKYGIEFKEYGFTFKKVLFKHGDIVRKFSGYTAKGEWEKEQVSGCSGHTHRLGVYYHTVRGGSYVWVESGCGCRLDAEYLHGGVANWQQGFAVFGFSPNSDHFYATVVPVINKKIYWGSKTYK